MKKEIKGKRCVMDQDYGVVKKSHDLIEEENLVVKEEKNYGDCLTIVDGRISGVNI